MTGHDDLPLAEVLFEELGEVEEIELTEATGWAQLAEQADAEEAWAA